MITLEQQSAVPIYQQIANKLEDFVIKGILSPGEQLPSVRAFAVELSINPNTIQKAYAELERAGVAVSVPGKGSFVTRDIQSVKQVRGKALLGEISALAAQARLMGVGEAEIMRAAKETESKGRDAL